MTSIPRLTLSTGAPRRIFVPFTRSMDIAADTLWEVVKKDRKSGDVRGVVFFFQTPKAGAKGANEFGVHSARLQPNGRADFSLWQDGISGWRTLEDGTVERLELPEMQVLDLAVGLGGPREFGLFVTWNPGLSDFQHVFFSPGDFVRLTNAANKDDELACATARDYHATTLGDRFILLDIPVIAILPASTAVAEYGDSMPTSLPKTGWFFPSVKVEWQFSSPRLHLSSGSLQADGEGLGLAVDFGTSASTVAIFPLVQSFTTEATRAADPLANLAPWSHCTEVVQQDTLTMDTDTVVAQRVRFSPSSRAIGEVPAYPFFIDGRRAPSQGQTQVPSIIHAPDFKSGSRLDMELVVNDDVGPQCFIGDEVRQLIDEGIRHHPSDKSARADWTRYLYAPKSLVGRIDRSPPIRDYIPDPIETYLRELFDQAYFTAMAGDRKPRIRTGLLRSVAYSYPVTWTDQQREAFSSCLRNALGKSLFAGCLPDGGPAEAISIKQSMDEASAAFLGFVMKRFSGLEGQQLLNAYQPFKPGSSGDLAELEPVNVLVFDCGEGTTDIVWLEIKQAVEKDTGTAARHVDSHVKRHFATEKAGLEVTRLVAQYVKEVLIRSNPDNEEYVRNWLGTKLEERGFLDEFDHQIGSRRAPHRMGLVHLFYQVAERLKIDGEIGPRKKDLVERLNASKIKGGAELALTDDVLRGIVRDVFDVAIDQVRSWFSDGPRVDVVIMSGRSCRLPELETMLREAIPPRFRPFAIDFVTPDTFLLEQTSEGEGGDNQIGKNSVVTGLVLNRYNANAVRGRALRCHPIDSMKRTRAIGVMARGIAANNKPFFSDDFELLVEPDNGLIDPTTDIGPIVIEKGEASGFSIGINFAGKKKFDVDKIDPVQEFIRVSIQGGSNDAVDSLSLYFRQQTSTDLRLSKVVLKKPGDAELSKTLAAGDAWKPITVGQVKVVCLPYSADTDFRNTGKIHIDADNAIDL